MTLAALIADLNDWARARARSRVGAGAGARTEVLIRYRVRPDALERHLELLRAVHAELTATRPAGVAWTSYRLEDRVSFVDLVVTDGPGRFSALGSWSAYRATLDERCDELPVVSELRPVAAYVPR